MSTIPDAKSTARTAAPRSAARTDVAPEPAATSTSSVPARTPSRSSIGSAYIAVNPANDSSYPAAPSLHPWGNWSSFTVHPLLWEFGRPAVGTAAHFDTLRQPVPSTVWPVTELPPDIPPWSPLARQDRSAHGGVRTAPPPDVADVALTEGAAAQGVGADGATIDGATTDGTATGVRRRRIAIWITAGLVAAIVVAIATTSIRTDDPAAPPVATVRPPLPTTTPADPSPLTSRVALGNGWTVRVRSFDRNATSLVAPLNPDTELPGGQRYVIADLEMTYLDGAPESQSPFYGVDIALVAADGTTITPADTPCNAPKPAFDMTAELDRGRAARGNVCFAVEPEQLKGLQLVAEPSMTYGSTPSYFELSTQS